MGSENKQTSLPILHYGHDSLDINYTTVLEVSTTPRKSTKVRVDMQGPRVWNFKTIFLLEAHCTGFLTHSWSVHSFSPYIIYFEFSPVLETPRKHSKDKVILEFVASVGSDL